MVREAGLSKSFGATLATANYAGYLLGALAGIVAPGLVRSTGVMRVALLASVATLALMPATHDHAAWFVLRFVAGGASALVFMFVVSAMLSHLRPADHLVGWGFGGVGAGIALSGVLVLITGPILDLVGRVVVFGRGRARPVWRRVAAHTTRTGRSSVRGTEPRRAARPSLVHGTVRRLLTGGHRLHHRRHVPGGRHRAELSRMGRYRRVDPILVGICALPASAIWAGLGRRWTRPSLLLAALLLQAIGIGMPAAE